jgi:protein-S-isoprenylcysteine O-methyltransferase Ste14
MNVTRLAYHFRFLIFVLLCILGFTAPWNMALHLDGRGINSHVWGTLAWFLAKSGAFSIGAAFNTVLAVGILFAVLGAWLRTWGTAYLGTDVALAGNLRGEGVVTDGPYRYMRNPLYLGGWINTLALAMLMPPSGAIFTMAVLFLLSLRTIRSEESFLSKQLGARYLEYCAKVPRLIPALSARVEASAAQPQWMQAIVSNLFEWGIALSLIAVGWKYNEVLLLQCVLVSLGVSIVAKALSPRVQAA